MKIFLLAAAAGILTLSTAPAEQGPGLQEQYKVGVILPLTGNSANAGAAMQRAIELAFELLPPAARERIKPVYEDDQMLPARSVSAFQKLLADDKIDAAIVFGSGAGMALGPAADERGIIVIALAASSKKVCAGRQYVFNHWMPLESQARKMVNEIARRNYGKIALVSHVQEGIEAIESAFIEALRAGQMEDRLVLKESFAPDTTDYRSFISRAKANGVDGVCVMMMPGGSGVFARQARELGLRAEAFGVEAFENDEEVKAARGALEGSWYVNTDDPGGWFVDRYREKFGGHPGLATANAFDSVNLLAQALMKEGHDNEKIARHLRTLENYPGACGTYSATGDNRFTLPVAVKAIRQGRFEKLVFPQDTGMSW